MDDIATLETRSSSIEVSRNSSNKYAFKVKLYYDQEKTKSNNIVTEIQYIYSELLKRFK